MLVALRLSTRIRCLVKLDSVVVYANNNRGFADKFSWKKNRPRERYYPGPEELGDISVLYNNNVVAGNIPSLVKICTKHINAFVECRNLPKAQSLFDLMIKKEVEPDVYIYTILMKGYSKIGHTKRVSDLFKEMEKKGIRPSVVTFNTAIQAYTVDGNLKGAQSFIEKMKRSYGLKPDVYTFGSMLNVCVSARDLVTARSLFDEMNSTTVEQNQVTMNTMIDVYAECCNEKNGKQYLEECRQLMQEMEGKGIKANKWTYNILLKLCSRGSLTTESIKILNEMRYKRMRFNIVSYATVLDGLSKDQTLLNEEVLQLSLVITNEMKKKAVCPDATTYNSLLNVSLRVGDLNWSYRLFREMRALKVEPTVVTYATMIKCYEKLGDPKNGDSYLKSCLELWQRCEEAGLKMDVEGYTSLLSACANVANLSQATNIWDKMIVDKVKPNVFIYTAMIKACLSKDKDDLGFDFLDQMKASGIKPNVVTYGTFLSYYVKTEDRGGAEKVCDEMKTLGIEPNKVMLRMLKALGIK